MSLTFIFAIVRVLPLALAIDLHSDIPASVAILTP
jgi:hypothetical protein